MERDRIERDVHVAAPVERVWELVTSAEHVGRWFGDAGAEIDLRVGGAMLVSWREHGTVRCRIDAVEPPRRFAYRWPASFDSAATEPAPGNETHVELTLAPEGDGTRLRVVERGFASLAVDDARREEKLAGNRRGWQLELDDLLAHAEAQTGARTAPAR